MSRIPPKPPSRGSNVHRRVVGSSPEIGKIGRISTEPRRRRKRSTGTGKRSSRSRRRTSRVLTNWLILVLSLTGLVIGGVLFWSFLNQKSPEPLPVAQAAQVPSLPSDEALSMVERMLSAKKAMDLEGLIRPGELSIYEAFDFLEKLRSQGTSIPLPQWFGAVDSLSVPIELVTINYSDSVRRTALFTLDRHGDWKLDFDAFAELCIPDFSALLEGREDEGLLRVHLSKDSYFNAYFADENEWDCFLLKHPRIDTNLYGYCKRGSRAHSAMMALYQRALQHASLDDAAAGRRSPSSPAESRATVYVKHPTGAEARQFEITHVISDDWVISDKPLDERLAEQAER